MTYKLTEVEELPHVTRASDYRAAVDDFRNSSAIYARVEFEGVSTMTAYMGIQRAIGKSNDVARMLRDGELYLVKVRR